MKTKHTPEPWRIKHQGHGVWGIETADGEYGVCEIVRSKDAGKATAQHIVNCVNAWSEIIGELKAYHDREWKIGHEGIPAHACGEQPNQCGACAALHKAEEHS